MAATRYRLLAGLVAATFATTSCGSSPSPSDPRVTPTPAGSAAGGLVVSDRFGWSIQVPEGWRYRPASAEWPPYTYPAPGAAYTDNLEADGGWPVLDVSTQPLPTEQAPDEFLSDLDAGTAAIGCAVEATGTVTVDGVRGRLQRQTCAGGSETVYEVVAFDGGRAYVIYWLALVGTPGADEASFRAILATFRFPS